MTEDKAVWVLVPKEANKEMQADGAWAWLTNVEVGMPVGVSSLVIDQCEPDAARTYVAMLAARPPIPDAEVEALARVICETSTIFESAWDAQTPVGKAIWRQQARAVLAHFGGKPDV